LREIGTIAGESDARVLADYLLTLDISTKLVGRSDGAWAIWVHKEDRIPQARKVLDEFTRDPADPRFHAAAPTAREIRKKAEKEEAGYRKRVRDFRNRWEGPIYYRAPLTFGLMLTCIVVTALTHIHLDLDPPLDDWLSFSVVAIDGQGFLRDSGFEQIRHGEVWRLVTPIFLHGGIAHLFFNMLALLAFGEQIEFRKGTWKLAAFVLVTAIASNVAQFLHSGGSFGGISGVVFAMAGYLWIKGQYDPDDHLSLDPRTANWMIAWFLLGIIAPLTAGPNHPHVFPYNMANVAHGVGLAGGILFGLLRL
jgi:GlpG protein